MFFLSSSKLDLHILCFMLVTETYMYFDKSSCIWTTKTTVIILFA